MKTMPPQFWLGLSQWAGAQTVFGLELKVETIGNIIDDTRH